MQADFCFPRAAHANEIAVVSRGRVRLAFQNSSKLRHLPGYIASAMAASPTVP